MADKKITELDELTTSDNDDLIAIVDITGTDTTKKQTKQNFLKEVNESIQTLEDDINNLGGWVYDATPTGAVNGSNLVFTIPESSQVVVYADGVRVKGGGVTYTFSGGDTITFVSGLQPMSTLSVDYLPV